jgi:hypothetical protein
MGTSPIRPIIYLLLIYEWGIFQQATELITGGLCLDQHLWTGDFDASNRLS